VSEDFKALWERDSKSLSVAIGQRNTARAVAEDNRARYVTAERERDELAEALREAIKVLSDSDEEGLIEHSEQMVRWRALADGK